MGSHRAVGALPRSPGRASLRYFFGSLHLPVGRCHQDCPVTDGSGVSGQRVDCQVTRVVCIHTLGAEKHVHPQSAATQGLRQWEGRRGWGVWGSLFFRGGGGLPAEGNGGEGPVHGNRKVCAWDVAPGPWGRGRRGWYLDSGPQASVWCGTMAALTSRRRELAGQAREMPRPGTGKR